MREVVLDATLEEGELGALLAALLPASIDVVAVAAPCPRPRGVKRAPWLASEDREERRAAVAATKGTIDRAGELGARVVVLELGALPPRPEEPALLRAHARRQLDSDKLERLVALRRAASPRALDLCRHGLDPLLEHAAAAGVVLALANRPRWLDLPSAAETASLLEDFRGAPLASWYDAAAAHVRRGFGLGAGRPAIELEAAAGAWLTDAAGLRGGLPWGTGDVDRSLLEKLPASALRVVHAAPPITDEELASALA